MPLIDYAKLPQPLTIEDLINALGNDDTIDLLFLAHVTTEIGAFLNTESRLPLAERDNFMISFYAAVIKRFNLTDKQIETAHRYIEQLQAEQEKMTVIENLIEIRHLIAAPFLAPEKFNQWLQNNFEYAGTIKNFSKAFKEVLDAHPDAATQYREAVIGKDGTDCAAPMHIRGLFNNKKDFPQQSTFCNETGDPEVLMREFLTTHPKIRAFLYENLHKIMACGRAYEFDNPIVWSEVDKEFDDLYKEFPKVATTLAHSTMLDEQQTKFVADYAQRLTNFASTLNNDDPLHKNTQTLINRLSQKLADYDDRFNETHLLLSNLKALLFSPIKNNPTITAPTPSPLPRSLSR